MKKVFMIFSIIMCIGITTPVVAYPVYYNTNSHIYHKHNCKHAKKCTKNCITIDDSEAIKRGGRPCKICGG
jgi:hypothetical protein